ncbi:MAG TPA: ATP-binding protein, partial [Nitrospira sp.]|nr:ATP-binding protein [Nitrospira sp.]
GWHDTEVLIREVLTLASHAIPPDTVDVRCQMHPLVPQLWCDGPKMKQVLLNLVLNAVQAMPKGGTLTLTACPSPPEIQEVPAVHITVSDTGTGIPAELQSRVFDPFFTTKDQGTGLGLAIVHALVEAHHGRIDVESRPGHGTSFVITLPRGPRQPSSTPVSLVTVSAPSERSRHITSITEEKRYE